MSEDLNNCIVPHEVEGKTFSLPLVYIHGYTLSSIYKKESNSFLGEHKFSCRNFIMISKLVDFIIFKPWIQSLLHLLYLLQTLTLAGPLSITFSKLAPNPNRCDLEIDIFFNSFDLLTAIIFCINYCRFPFFFPQKPFLRTLVASFNIFKFSKQP